jgi:hypothetical protein
VGSSARGQGDAGAAGSRAEAGRLRIGTSNKRARIPGYLRGKPPKEIKRRAARAKKMQRWGGLFGVQKQHCSNIDKRRRLPLLLVPSLLPAATATALSLSMPLLLLLSLQSPCNGPVVQLHARCQKEVEPRRVHVFASKAIPAEPLEGLFALLRLDPTECFAEI